jgi:hypothetical protein
MITGMMMLFVGAGQATAADRCVDRQAVGDMAITLIPPLMDSFTKRCAALTPATAFLKQGAAAQLREKLAVAAKARISSTARGFRSVGEKAPPGLSDQTIVNMMIETMPAILIQDGKVDVAMCGDVDQLFAAMSPMSPDQVAQFTVALLSLSKVKDPAICAP